MVDQAGPVATREQQAVPVAQEAMVQPGFVVWHSSEEDGGPDVGITVGLGDGKMLWIGERSGREGDGMGLLVYGDQAIDANASLGEYDEIRDLIEQHVAPALSRLAATSLHDMQITPSLPLPCKSGEGAGVVSMVDGVAIIDTLVRDNMRRWIVDGWTEGNMTWEEADEFTQESAEYAADAVLEGLKCAAEDAALTPDATQTREAELPDDVRALVIAAREFWDDENSGTVRSHALDKALEAFSSRVPYDDEPLNARGGA